MCTTSLTITEVDERLDGGASQDYYHSPSSVFDVDLSTDMKHKRQKICCTGSPANEDCAVLSPSGFTGDTHNHQDDAGSALTVSSGSDVINEAVAHTLSSSPSRKRKFSEIVDDQEQDCATFLQFDEPTKRKPTVENICRESPIVSEDRDDGKCVVANDDDDDPAGADDDEYHAGVDIKCSGVVPRYSRRTLYIEYWSRTDECKERKWDHLDEINERYGSAEEHIFATTLNGRTAFLEPNMFPYDTPAGIEHWTLWHVDELNHEQIKQYVENWIDANAPHVERWNYDDNPERSIDIFHVHVYFQVADGTTVLQDRKVEDLVHELD